MINLTYSCKRYGPGQENHADEGMGGIEQTGL